MARLDHLAVAARSLEEGAAYVEARLGAQIGPGGAHPAMGTHNLLMSLGESCYLEVIAVDPGAPAPARPRWFGLDGFDAAPRLITWIIATEDISACSDICGPPIAMTRGALSWQITVQESGALPHGGCHPSFISWDAAPHPAGAMRDCGCRFAGLTVSHPEAAQFPQCAQVELRPGPPGLEAIIDTPNGPRSLT